MRINKAAEMCDIPYENAKLINKVYLAEGRKYRIRTIQPGGFGNNPGVSLAKAKLPVKVI